MKTKWIITTLCIVAIATAAIGFRLTVQADASAPADQTGPYKVGFFTNTYYDSARSDFAGGPRPIQTFIWYPAAPDNNGNPMPPAVYPMISLVGSTGLPDAPSIYFEAYGIDLAFQEVAASKDGPFPLVVFSPGQGASSTLYIQIGARLASHGFVVAIPTNYDDRMTATGEKQFYPSEESYTLGIYIERTRDIQYLMTRLVADSQQTGNLLSGTIRPDQIAVSGHSVGGGAALALAGGDDRACDFPGVDPTIFPSENCVPILPDPRIRAVITIDGSNWFLYYAELARIKIPNMGIGREWNTLKSVSPGYEHDQARQHAAIQSHPSYRVDVAYANHMSFANVCAVNQVLHDQGIIDDGTLDQILKIACPSEPVSEEEIGSLTAQYMIAFLKTVLVGETGYQEILTPSYALDNEPFIEFFETEKGSPNPRDEDAYFSYFMHQPGTLRAKALKDHGE
jgi:predicted dienelactone hydrolase